ncbi:MAG: putative hydro-lyase [Acidaminococcales bacterium]|jgi:uncharacterized protein YcsI (UPF0317 family)|nr:putative hydro-lyase [Acidaminococcales bacterium]
MNKTAAQTRQKIREGIIDAPTSGLAPGHVQANLAIVTKDLAYDFLLFAQRNPKPCPILDVTDTGSPVPRLMAPGADIRYDVPRYFVYENGVKTSELKNLENVWRDDFVAFLIGCSFSFETAMLNAGLPIRHIEEKRNVPMYITNMPCVPAGTFHGDMVCSMRPLSPADAIRAVKVTARFPSVHGSPVHLGDPAAIGVKDINKPDFGDPPVIREGEIPVFWACGVTPQSVAMASKPPIMITHAPGYMFICDKFDEDLSVF